MLLHLMGLFLMSKIILKIKEVKFMSIFIILLFLFTIFSFYSMYIPSLYALRILQGEPRNFPLAGFFVFIISFFCLCLSTQYEKYVIIFFLFMSAMIWILHLYSFIKNKGSYPFTNNFAYHFFVAAIIHGILYSLVIL